MTAGISALEALLGPMNGWISLTHAKVMPAYDSSKYVDYASGAGKVRVVDSKFKICSF